MFSFAIVVALIFWLKLFWFCYGGSFVGCLGRISGDYCGNSFGDFAGDYGAGLNYCGDAKYILVLPIYILVMPI